MDAIKHLIANIPDWLKRLEELNGQIEQRQVELAQLTESQSPSGGDGPAAPATKSLRHKGSTESLRPQDEPEAHPRESTPQPVTTTSPEEATIALAPAPAPATTTKAQPPAPVGPLDSHSPSAIARQTSQARAAGQARARATLRKRQRSDSVVSAEGAAPVYRTRSMIIVYYDSYVQLFFEDLVKFVSASRNMMRKAKMAAKVAQIKRLAELDMPDDEDDEDEEEDGEGESGDKIAADPNKLLVAAEASGGKKDTAEEELAPLRFMSTRRMQPMASPGMMMASGAFGRSMYARAGRFGRASGLAGGLDGAEADIYDHLDKGLEYVQSMCEHAAHQFLRDGDCAEEVANIQRRMAETKGLADREMERVQREDPAALKPVEDETRVRNYRPPIMRRDIVSPSSKSGGAGATGGSAKDAAAATVIIAPAVIVAAGSAHNSNKGVDKKSVGGGASNELEVDEGVEDMDAEDTPTQSFKNSRMMT